MARRITVRNFQRAVPVNLTALRKVAEKALSLVLRLRQTGRTTLQRLDEVCVALISDRRMSGLHRQFLDQAGPTDVMTFEHGEIFISAETARKNARRFGNSLGRELELYVIHGLLHLHGFDDRTARDADRMKQIQKKILATLN
jgi:probable rRNA maturation factor